MGREMKKLIEAIRAESLKLRRLLYILDSPLFEEVSKTGDVKELEKALTARSLEALVAWLDKYKENSLETMSYRQLRERARAVGVVGYSNMDKPQLIKGIRGSTP